MRQSKSSTAHSSRLLTQTSTQDRERLITLVQNTSDPTRKLALWGAYHKAHAMLDVDRHDDPTNLNLHEREDQHTARQNAAATTTNEVDLEMAELQSRKEGFSAADVDRLMQRKAREHQLEMKYATNFTNDGARRPPGDARGEHVHWTDDELQVMDRNLSQVPRHHLAEVSELHRTPVYKKAGGYYDPATHRIAVTDAGITGDFRISGDHREHAEESDRDIAIQPLDAVSAHEVGHNVADASPAAFAKYQALTTSPDALPTPGQSSKGASGTDDPYEYARTSPDEQFAEHYNMAVHTPERVHQDFVEGPKSRRLHAQENLQEMLDARAQDVASGKPVATAQEWDSIIAEEQTRYAIAADEEDVRRQEFEIMRNDVFHTDKEQAKAQQRLQELGLDEKELAEFNARAATASTPEQLQRIEADYYGARGVPREITITDSPTGEVPTHSELPRIELGNPAVAPK